MLSFDDSGQPRSTLYRDVYKSRAGAAAEARQVFVGGARAAERWRGRERFTVLELGFGLGVNFLATLDAWRADRQRCARLHFVSIEGHPLGTAELEKAHEALGVGGADARRLLDRWPPRTPGLHRIEFDAGDVTLTIAIGDVAALLPRLALAADAFYLDGFAPDRNPAMWSASVIKGLARLANPEATLATYSAAASVRAALEAAGFQTELRPGFGGKRHRLEACYAPRWRGYPAPPLVPHWTAREAIVIGGGLAGCASAAALARRGWQVTLLERRAALACEGSGQPAVADHLHVSPDDNPLARLTRAALLLAGLDAPGPHRRARIVGRLALADDDEDERRQHETARVLGFPPTLLQAVDRRQACDIAGVALRHGGLWMPACRVGAPPRLCESWIAGAGAAVRVLPGIAVDRLQQADGQWTAVDAQGRPIARAPVAVLANAGDAFRLAAMPGPPLRQVRGQTTLLGPPVLAGLRTVIGGVAYACPLPGGQALVGSTFDDGESLLPEPAADLSNLRRLALMLDGADPPDAWAGAAIGAALGAATGLRHVARDRLPLIGPIPDVAACRAQAAAMMRNARLPLPALPGLFGAFGFGSRGLLWASLAAESIGAALDGEPPVLEADLLGAIDPGRFLRHALRRGRMPR